jgi:serine/threonine protein kinase
MDGSAVGVVDLLIDDPHADVFGLVGKLFDDTYQVTRVVGAGSVGVVYEAMHTKLRARRALKILRVEGVRDPERMLERFWREARASASLRNAGAVEVYDARLARESRRPYFAMDLLDGISLHTQWSLSPGKRMPVAEALGCARQIAECMTVAHAAGIVHRDLKPENIFLARDHSVKVLDFGCALIAQEPRLTAPGMMIGLPLYQPPEQLDFVRARTPDPRMDVYALGVTLYHVLSGQYVYPLHRDPLVVARYVHEGPPRDIATVAPDLPPAVHSLVRRAIARNPEERMSSMDAVAAEISRLLKSGDVPLHVYPHSATVARTRPATEKPTIVERSTKRDASTQLGATDGDGIADNIISLVPSLTNKTADARPRRNGGEPAPVARRGSPAPASAPRQVRPAPVQPVVAATPRQQSRTPPTKRRDAGHRYASALWFVAGACAIFAAAVAIVWFTRLHRASATIVRAPVIVAPPGEPSAPSATQAPSPVAVEKESSLNPAVPTAPATGTTTIAPGPSRRLNRGHSKQASEPKSEDSATVAGPQLDENLNGLANPFSK